MRPRTFDYTGGASVFAGTDRPAIYSHQLFVERVPDAGRAGRDGGDQFGSTLPAALYINGGTGTEFGRPSGPAAMKPGALPPTSTFSGIRTPLTIAGVRMELLHTPGETNDGIAVWLAETRVLLTGDLFLKAFPNLYNQRECQELLSLGRPVSVAITSALVSFRQRAT